VVLRWCSAAADMPKENRSPRSSWRAVFRPTDVTRHADNEALVELAIATFGRLDAAFNNAGLEATGGLVDFDDATYDKVFDTNVRSVFSAIRAQIPHQDARVHHSYKLHGGAPRLCASVRVHRQQARG
jgi:NAD(P)-dependent dehydrogenase (short-subunit alcohol dehydrogenase family)